MCAAPEVEPAAMMRWLAALSSPPMNLFTGMTDRQIWSAVLMIGLFTFWSMCVAASLAAFYISSRPTRGGRVRTGSLWHIGAMLLFMVSVTSGVWAAPAEKSFVDPNGTMFTGDRFTKVIVGLVFTFLGFIAMAAGGIVTSSQKREAAQQSLASPS
jgi:hypothetical protein